MAEGGRQPPVINVQLPAINVHYQEGTRFAGDNVGQKTKVQAGEIGQIVIPTPASNEQTPNRYSSCDVTDDIARMNLTQAMDFVTYDKQVSHIEAVNEQTTFVLKHHLVAARLFKA
ncbi:uncharacterized protein LOC120342699 [Styela clava]